MTGSDKLTLSTPLDIKGPALLTDSTDIRLEFKWQTVTNLL